MDYRPIDCNFYDELEAIATLGREAHLLYKKADGTSGEAVGKIVNLFAKNKEEFLVLDTGFELRLDHLISVNDKKL